MKKINFFVLLVLLCPAFDGFAANFSAFEVPKLTGRINDHAGILNSSEESQLESVLRNTEAKTSSQIVLLTIPSLEEENLEDYSIRVVEKWQIGQKEYDNGALLLIALAEKKVRIEVGYGLEHILTDLKSDYIIRNLIVSEFKRGDFYKGISNGLLAMSGLISGEFEITDEELAQYQRVRRKSKKVQIPFGLIIFVIMMLLGSSRRRGRRGSLLPMIFLGSMLGGSGRSSGGSSFGGFGGFSGGGGSFGGGGASGGW